MNKTKLLLCINDTPHSRVTLRFACSKAKKSGYAVEMLHVIDTADNQNFLSMADVMRQEQRDEAEELLKKFADECYETYGVTPSLLIKEGLIGEQIVATAQADLGINMLLVGTSPETVARSNLIPWLTGQLGSKLQIPMLIIPGNLTDQQIDELT